MSIETKQKQLSTTPSKPQGKVAPSTTGFTKLSGDQVPEWANKWINALNRGALKKVETP